MDIDLSYSERAVLAHAVQVLAIEVRRGLSCGLSETELRALRDRLAHSDFGRCEHPGLLPGISPWHPRREREQYQAWLDSTVLCGQCGSDVKQRDL
jgi:hypothetical protein